MCTRIAHIHPYNSDINIRISNRSIQLSALEKAYERELSGSATEQDVSVLETISANGI